MLSSLAQYLCATYPTSQLPTPHPPSRSCTSTHVKSQLHSAHLGQRYAPMYPHDEHSLRAGVVGAEATAVRYGGIGSFG